MRTSVKIALFFGLIMYMALTFLAFIYCEFNHAEAWIYSTAQMMPLVYFSVWACYKSRNTRRTNLFIGLGYVLLWIGLIALWCYSEDKGFRFTAEEFQMYDTRNTRTILGITYGWFAAIIITLLLVLTILHLFLYIQLDPKDNMVDKTSFIDQLSKFEQDHKPRNVGTSIMGAHLLDKALHSHKKHDHSLGSYWADHDDDGNYDPGAWRRKYEQH